MLANWPEICRLMMDKMHETWSIAVVIYKLTMGFAVIGVIFGVFTQETFSAAECDDQLILRKKKAQHLLHHRKMCALYDKMGHTEGDAIDSKTFKEHVKNEDISHWLTALNYDTSDADLMFYLMDTNNDG